MKRLILPVSTFLLITVGCDNPAQDNAVELDSSELQDLSSELASDLGLSQSSANEVNDVLNRYGRGGKHREPGFLWKVAGELTVKLSEEEKARLFEKMEEHDIPLFGDANKRGTKFRGGKRGGHDFGGIVRVLTDDQKASFKEIMVSYKEKFEAINNQVNDGSISKEDARTQMAALKEAMKAEIGALLTDEQRAQIEQNKAEWEAKRQEYRDASKAVMVDVLEMTSDQISKFDAINQEARDAAKALFEQAKNGDINRTSLREGLKNIFTEKNEKFEALFSVSQIEIIKIHKALELRMKKHRGQKDDRGDGPRGGKGRGGRRGNKG